MKEPRGVVGSGTGSLGGDRVAAARWGLGAGRNWPAGRVGSRPGSCTDQEAVTLVCRLYPGHLLREACLDLPFPLPLSHHHISQIYFLPCFCFGFGFWFLVLISSPAPPLEVCRLKLTFMFLFLCWFCTPFPLPYPSPPAPVSRIKLVSRSVAFGIGSRTFSLGKS